MDLLFLYLWPGDSFCKNMGLIETYHYTNEEIDRDYITALIKEVCEENLGV